MNTPMVRLKGLTLGVRAEVSDRPPLLLLHGLLSCNDHWLPNLHALRGRYRLILAELPGHGDTPGCTDTARLHPDALADDLDRARQRLGLRRWYICGQSFGAGITLRHALRSPQAVAAQIWTNANRVLAPPPDGDSLANDHARCDRLGSLGVEALQREPFHPRHGRRFPPELRTLLAARADQCDIPTVIGLIQHCLPHLSLIDRFTDTQVPTLPVNGRLESRFQPAREMAHDLLPSMEVEDLPGGHAINIECPDQFDDAALRFLSRYDNML